MKKLVTVLIVIIGFLTCIGATVSCQKQWGGVKIFDCGYPEGAIAFLSNSNGGVAITDTINKGINSYSFYPGIGWGNLGHVTDDEIGGESNRILSTSNGDNMYIAFINTNFEVVVCRTDQNQLWTRQTVSVIDPSLLCGSRITSITVSPYDGSIMITWVVSHTTDYTTFTDSLMASIFDPIEKEWSEAHEIYNGIYDGLSTANPIRYANTVADNNSNFIVFWVDTTPPSGWGVARTTTYKKNGGWGNIDSSFSIWGIFPYTDLEIRLDSKDNSIVLVWETTNEVNSQVLDLQTHAWSDLKVLFDSSGEGSVYELHTAISNDGIYTCWNIEKTDGCSKIYAVKYDKSWSSPISVYSGKTYISNLTTAAAPDGTLMISWIELGILDYIKAAVKPPHMPWLPARVLNSGGTDIYIGLAPFCGFDKDSDAYVMWGVMSFLEATDRL
jgi:hypothetical protein